MTNKLGYTLYSARLPNEEDVRLFAPGLFQWVAAFEKYGKFGRMSPHVDKHELEDSDIVHVNYTPTNESYIAALREELGEHSSTRIIANVDFGTMMWNGIDPLVMKQQLSLADMVFHVESTGAQRLERLLGKKVHVIPHPTNVEDIKKGIKPTDERSASITCQYHRYADTWDVYYYGLMNIRKEYDLRTILMNFEPKDKAKPRVPIICMFTELINKMNYRDYLQLFANAFVNVDITFDHTYGRGIVEAAALGIPTIGSNTIEAMHILWPDLEVEPGNDVMMGRVMRKLLDDDEFREEMITQGFERCEYYSLEDSYLKMLVALGEET